MTTSRHSPPVSSSSRSSRIVRDDNDDDDRHDSRKRSKSSHHSKSIRNDDDYEEQEDKPLPLGVDSISSDDYFIKSTEFKVWLDEFKRKRLDALSGDDARRYFKKFVKSWNRGQLESKFYRGIASSSISSSISSAYSWNFKSATQRELDDASSIRKSIDYSRNPNSSSSGSSSNKAILGPMLPLTTTSSSSALESLQFARSQASTAQSDARAQSKALSKADQRSARDEARDNQSTGRDRQVEKRREGNQERKEIAASRESGGMVEISEEDLMGSGGSSSFQAMINARDRVGQKPNRKQQAQEERKAVMTDKAREFKSKEDSTMAMLRKLAADRFGT